MKKMIALVVTSFVLFALTYAQGFEDIGSFKTPSNNIHCIAWRDKVAGKAELQCEMTEITAKIPATPKDCELDYGYRFGMSERGKAERGCYGDTIKNPNYKTLAYGKTWKSGGFTCDVTTARLRCTNLDKRGFELSKAVQKFF
jgi:hypothetical protein